MSENGIIDILSKKINEWAAHKSHSLINLGKTSGVSYPTIRRIVQRETKSTSSDNAIALLEAVGTAPEEIKKILDEHYAIGEFVGPTLSVGSKTQLESILGELFKYKIFGMCDTVKGIHESVIAERFGSNGKDVLDELLAKELVQRNEDGQITAKSNLWMSGSWALEVQVMRNCLSFFTEKSFENGLSSTFHHTEGLNTEGVEALKKNALDKAMEDRKIVSDPKFHGNIPMFSISAVGSFDDSIVHKKGQK